MGFCAVGLLVGWLGDWGGGGIYVYLYSLLPFAVFSVEVYFSQLIGRKRRRRTRSGNGGSSESRFLVLC